MDRSYPPFKLLVFDLDGTLLRGDKTVSRANLRALEAARAAGAAICVATSRSERNAQFVLGRLKPDALITNGGASVKVGGEQVFSGQFTPDETARIIACAREICGEGVYMDVDTGECCWRNYTSQVFDDMGTWGETRDTDFRDFRESSFMVCVEIPSPSRAQALGRALDICDTVKFAGGDWYKLTKTGVTKKSGLDCVLREMGLGYDDAAAFGDDLSDIGMLRASHLGVAMGNAVPEVLAAADVVIGGNDTDAIAELLAKIYKERWDNNA